MSRSKRHAPIRGLTADSEKDDKKILHGKLRAKLRVALRKMLLELSSEEYIAPNYDEVHNKWIMAKDGNLHFFPKRGEDKNEFDKMMRK
jgi:hypothetical protein